MNSSSDPEVTVEQLEAILGLVLRKNSEDYRALSDGTEALEIGKLAAANRGDLIMSSDFQDVVRSIDWPTRTGRKNMTWSAAFGADEAGTAAFRDAQLNGELNNFHVYLRCQPIDVSHLPVTPDASQGMDGVAYATHPAFVRACAVAPELFEALRGVFREYKPLEMRQHMEACDASNPLWAAMRTAYGVMGRCVRSDDVATQMRILGADGFSAEPDTDVSAVITR